MNREQVIAEVFDEIRRAEAKFPGWPEDFVYGAVIVGEESGERVARRVGHRPEEGETMSEIMTEQMLEWFENLRLPNSSKMTKKELRQETLRIFEAIRARLVAHDVPKAAAETLWADIRSALGALENEGPRLAAMRVRSERDSWHRLSDEQAELLKKAEAEVDKARILLSTRVEAARLDEATARAEKAEAELAAARNEPRLQALVTIRDGYNAENARGNSPVYGIDYYRELANSMEALAAERAAKEAK